MVESTDICLGQPGGLEADCHCANFGDHRTVTRKSGLLNSVEIHSVNRPVLRPITLLSGADTVNRQSV